MSVLFAIVILTLWRRLLRRRYPSIKAKVCVDDRNIWAKGRPAEVAATLAPALQFTRRSDGAVGLRWSVKRNVCVIITRHGMNCAAKKLPELGKPSSKLKTLGVTINFTRVARAKGSA